MGARAVWRGSARLGGPASMRPRSVAPPRDQRNRIGFTAETWERKRGKDSRRTIGMTSSESGGAGVRQRRTRQTKRLRIVGEISRHIRFRSFPWSRSLPGKCSVGDVFVEYRALAKSQGEGEEKANTWRAAWRAFDLRSAHNKFAGHTLVGQLGQCPSASPPRASSDATATARRVGIRTPW